MGLCCGLVGLPNVGKTTVFNALVRGGAVVANYPFATVETNVGIAHVPDARLDRLVEIYKPKRVTPSTLEVRDIAGLVEGASHGEGLGNQFLAQIREVDALLHVVRCFEDPNVAHVDGPGDPLRDMEIIETELLLADLETLSRRQQRLEKRAKTGDVHAQKEVAFLHRLTGLLDKGRWPAEEPFSPEETKCLQDYQLLSSRPTLYIANVSEGMDAEAPAVRAVSRMAERKGARVIPFCGQLEADLASLPEAERSAYLHGLGLQHQMGREDLMAAAHGVMGLITFFTTGEEEVRAWTIRKGTKAQEAAGKIHTDMQRGFIRAEVFSYTDLLACGTPARVREKGLFRLEGREYVIQEGDIVYFRFHV